MVFVRKPDHALGQPVELFEVDFSSSTMSDVPPASREKQEFRVRVLQSGVIHAVVSSCWSLSPLIPLITHIPRHGKQVGYFELFVDRARKHVVSTHPSQTSRTRDMAWGQQLQTVEDWRKVKVRAQAPARRSITIIIL
jgi:hypothetical protein